MIRSYFNYGLYIKKGEYCQEKSITRDGSVFPIDSNTVLAPACEVESKLFKVLPQTLNHQYLAAMEKEPKPHIDSANYNFKSCAIQAIQFENHGNQPNCNRDGNITNTFWVFGFSFISEGSKGKFKIPLEPSHEIVLENPFHKFPRRTMQVDIDSKGWTTMAEG
jgi:hypothetical protein